MNVVAIPVERAAGAAEEQRSARRQRFALLLRSPIFVVGVVILGAWILCAVFGTRLAPHDPFETAVLDRLRPPSGGHWFGTDALGRDVLSRVIVGARGILIVAPLATLLGTVAGTAIGLFTGYFGGLADEAAMRLVDAFLAVPVVIVGMLALVALGPSTFSVIVVIGLVFTPIIARTVRAAVLQERELEYIQAARLRRERSSYILFSELLPNVMGTVLVEFTVRLGYAIFATATLSFLGFGIQPPAPDWGLAIFEHYAYLAGGFWWPTLFPALAIASLVVAVNLISDAITQAYER